MKIQEGEGEGISYVVATCKCILHTHHHAHFVCIHACTLHNVRVQIFIRQKSLQIYIIFVFWLKLCLIYDLVLAYMPQHRSFWFQLLFWPQHIIKPEPGLSAYKLRLMEAYRNGFSREYTSFTCGQRIMRWSGWHMDRTIQSAVVNPPYQMLIVH